MLVGNAFNKAASIANAVNDFKKTGIYPMNMQVYKDLATSEKFQKNNNSEQQTLLPTATNGQLCSTETNKNVPNPSVNSVELPINVNFSGIEENAHHSYPSETNCDYPIIEFINCDDSGYISNISGDFPNEIIIIDDLSLLVEDHKENIISGLSYDNTVTNEIPQAATESFSNEKDKHLNDFKKTLNEIAPIAPTQSEKKSNREKQKSEILTSSPVKELLKEKHLKKEVKKEKIEQQLKIEKDLKLKIKQEISAKKAEERKKQGKKKLKNKKRKSKS